MLDTAALPNSEGTHPVVATMRDIVLAKAVDGEPTLEEDLAHFTLAEIKTHFPTARKLAHAQIVRQVDDSPNFESRARLLVRATKLLLGKMPTEITLHATLRAHGIGNNEIADLWPDLMASTADAFERSRKLPQLRVVS
ncbi:hypothetical protein [Devosia sp.]|jgi:hypothetical protein|uniref:hypothetical protein n=1 Tax=Devosia sp. TaxID=1871048 RepID=UPI003EEFB3D6